MNPVPLHRESVVPQTSRPDPSRLVAGDPVHTTWNVEERGALFAGIWQSTPGKWRVAYDEWEYVHILSGHSVLTDDQGSETVLKTGDRWIIRPGFSGTWEVIETTVKDYVILA
ncbi:hypothetical protein SAMN05421774_104205 [Gemmobacter megaterium]|uniref:(S)-ureidoglycine aminohydrolase cupin domain-containing protein n=1 Tax=Gemmobacter megaterium TaxID=1086013 RepID=A0A1N7NX30_9RHOB|nr:cupin domain-containing protein [Gemmobacter megaterium]GGE16096.1 cupin [Gemmobacter megaterium]SIT02882.1 hypothetical protein SAMN05421774_104205 [Gemmobacter megaterium]